MAPHNEPPRQAKKRLDNDDLEIILQVAEFLGNTRDTKLSLILAALNRLEAKQAWIIDAIKTLLQGNSGIDPAVVQALADKLTAEATSLEESVRAASE